MTFIPAEHSPESPSGNTDEQPAARASGPASESAPDRQAAAQSQPFHQGQLDVLCGVYAVLNALRAVHPLGMGQARRLFNEVLLDLAHDRQAMHAVLYNVTDHAALVEATLDRAARDVAALRVVRPFPHAPGVRVAGRASHEPPAASRSGRRVAPDASAQPTPRAVWETLSGWLLGGRARAAVLRFHRYLPFRGDPVVSHWTAAGRMLGDMLALFDSSREPNAVHCIDRRGFVTAPEHLDDDRLLLIEARCLYLIEPAD